MDEPMIRRKIDVLYDDVVGDVRELIGKVDPLKTAITEAESHIMTTLAAFKGDMIVVSRELVAQASLLEGSVKADVQEEAKKVAIATSMQIRAAAAEAVTQGARQAALKVLAEPMDDIQRAYKEISEKTMKLKDLAEQIQQKLIVQWWKVLAIAVLFLVLGGSLSIFIGRKLEARFPAFSESELSVLRAGNMIIDAWDLLDKKTQDLILKGKD